MPKIIEGAREKILANAKRRLFENGYQHISLREVAKESGIATGTIYNYFANKDYLIANIMLEDWEKAVEKMDSKVTSAVTVKEGVLGICQAIDEFCDIYVSIWQQPSVAAAATPDLEHRHAFLANQIGEKVNRLLEEKGYGNQKNFTALIVELILSSNGKEEVRKQLGTLMEQLYPSK
ncbi:MAG: TetR/AcrR family transcriptional regulator [Lachnospiraceae bacterium]|nr:TetR/AcrR family transcriptional regulator [Lachnospiraceae bacterium]